MDSVLISVIVPAYNYAHTLPRAVRSVVGQLSPRSELLVIDDGSTDETPQVVENLQNEFGKRFRYLRKANGGLASVRNCGIDEGQGQFLVFLDADDELSKNALSILERHIAANPQTRMVIGGHVAVLPGGKERVFRPGILAKSADERLRDYLFRKKMHLANGACAMHRDVFLRGRYPENFRSAEDIPVFAQVLANCVCTVLPDPIAIIHKHDDSMRHQFDSAHRVGVSLVEEVFSPQRLSQPLMSLKNEYFVQRCLSLFRSAYLAKEFEQAKRYFREAVSRDFRVVLRWSYVRKAARLWLGLS